jgi:hypothetical protein
MMAVMSAAGIIAGMTFLSQQDGSFWGTTPSEMRPLVDSAMEQGVPVSVFPLGDPADEEAPVAVMMSLPPGHVLLRHSHPCERFETIVAGSLDIGDRVLGPGDVMQARIGEAYGPHTAGPEGCVSVEVFSSRSGATKVTYETVDGPLTRNILAGDPPLKMF